MIVLLIIFLAVAGQLEFYTSPIFGVMFVFLGILALPLAIALWLRDSRPPLLLPAACLLLVPSVISTLANVDIANFALSRLLLFTIALAALVIGSAIDESHLRQGLHYAGMAWPVIWATDALSSWAHHIDLLGFWPVLFILSFWRTRYRLFAIPHVIILLHRTSRGAIVAVIIGLVVYEWLERGRPKPSPLTLIASGLGSVVGVWGLVMLRYSNAMARPIYWYDSWLAFLGSPIVGVGPYGLNVRELVLDPSSQSIHQIHAHNMFVSWLAETGLIGLACLVLVIAYLYCTRSAYQAKPWQLSFLAGVLVWSTVDQPLFWPGPLVAAALIVGTIPPKKF